MKNELTEAQFPQFVERTIRDAARYHTARQIIQQWLMTQHSIALMDGGNYHVVIQYEADYRERERIVATTYEQALVAALGMTQK